MKTGLVKIGVLVLFLFGFIPDAAYSRSVNSGRSSPTNPMVTHAPLSSLLPKLEQYAEKTRQDWKVPGMAVAIVEQDKLVYAKGFGVKQVGGTDPVDPHTIFQIGSTSKAFTAALVALQVDAKKLQWSDRVVEHLPDFMMADPWVTRELQVWDLMAQHSGMASYAGDLQSFIGFDRQHIIHSLRYLKSVSSFRSEFAYVNNLFLVAAALVEKVTGSSWETNIEQQIFQPLGMTESSTTLQEFNSASNRAIPHAIQDDAIVPLGKDWPFQHWVYVYGPAGGINSNVIDMAKWLQLQLGQGKFAGKPLIGAENMNFLHSPKTIIVAGESAKKASETNPLFGSGVYYAQGWLYVESKPYPLVWHNGGTTGCKTVVAFVPDAGVGIVVLSNLGGTEVPELLTQWFFDQYFAVSNKDWNQIVLKKVQKAKAAAAAKIAKPQRPSPALPFSAYTGTYRHDIYGEAIVTAKNGKLTLTLGPNKVKTQLHHYDRDTFTWVIDIPGFGEISLVRFNITAGKAATLTVEAFSNEGSGSFRRVDD